MKQIALVGEQLIHTYTYVAHFNGCRREDFERNAKPWMVKIMAGRDLSAKTDRARVSRIWSPDAGEAARLAQTFAIENVCGSLEEAIEGADGVMVMDEIIDSRTRIVETCLRAGRTVFADKVLAVDPSQTERLLSLAESKGARARAWSQLYFQDGLKPFREAPGGGVGVLNYMMKMDILPMYGIHPVSLLQGAFASRVRAYRPLSDGDRRTAMVALEDGTEILLHVGPNLPAHGRAYYCAGKQEVVASLPSEGGAFERAAIALVDLFTGEPCGGPGPERMIEASRLVDCLARGGSDGKEIAFSD